MYHSNDIYKMLSNFYNIFMILVHIYSTYLHILRRASVMDVWWRDEILDLTVRLYAAEVGHAFIFMDDNVRSHWPLVIDDNLENEGLCIWSALVVDVFARLLFHWKKFGMPYVALYVNLSQPQLFPQICKILYKRNGDYLTLKWLNTWSRKKHGNTLQTLYADERFSSNLLMFVFILIF